MIQSYFTIPAGTLSVLITFSVYGLYYFIKNIVKIFCGEKE